MQYIIISFCITASLLIVSVAINIMIFRKKSNKTTKKLTSESLPSIVKIEPLLPAAAPNANDLVEIKDKKLLESIGRAAPGFLEVGAQTANAVKFGSHVLYKAIIPSGETLAKSASMNGAFRGFYLGSRGIAGHASLVAINKRGSPTSIVNAAGPIFAVSALVVGQYYMSQIDSKLQEISNSLSKISNFQNNEYRSRVLSLLASITAITNFKMEILEKDEIRLSKANSLDDIERECTALLGQANTTIDSYTKSSSTDFKSYKKAIYYIQNWYTYQASLLNVLLETADLKYTLRLGKASKEQCKSLFLIYAKQTFDSQTRLCEWHKETLKQLGIDLKNSKRKREGKDYVLHLVPSLFDPKQKFCPLEENAAKMIEGQTSGGDLESNRNEDVLFSNDVELISKDGKIYYLPPKITKKTKKSLSSQ